MSTSVLPSIPLSRTVCRSSGGLHLRVVSICDGLIGAVYAHEAVEALSMNLTPEPVVTSSYWNFSMLQGLDVSHPSVQAAADADMIIVSSFAYTPLPACVRSWLMTVKRMSQQAPAAIIAFHPEAHGEHLVPCPACEFLDRFATRWATRFLSNEAFDRWLECGHAGEEFAARPQAQVSRPMAFDMSNRYLHGFRWGLSA